MVDVIQYRAVATNSDIMETELIQHNFQGTIIMADLIRREISVDNNRLEEPVTVWVS
jgi:hypothetical protein